MDDMQNKLRAIPAIDHLLTAAADTPCLVSQPHALVVGALREAVEKARTSLLSCQSVDISVQGLLRQAQKSLARTAEPRLKRVINATGVILHTNLGRAPLSKRAVLRINEVAAGYSNLEYDVLTGQRGDRHSHVTNRICSLTGAEEALVVNNNAAAVLLALSALACGREVIVSRGQLVEIGGSFRIPDVLRQSGAAMVEVGTTNKTRVEDYERVIGANTAAILKVHTSNYRIIGFTAQPEDEALVELASRYRLPIIEDLGSGTLLPPPDRIWREPTVQERIAAGIDVVTFSGDKLLGGGQAGFIVGKNSYLKPMRHHPLMRALRIDKLSLAAVEGTLLDYILGNPEEDVPVQRMLRYAQAELRSKADKLTDILGQLGGDWLIEVRPVNSQAGGGALPGVDFASFAVYVKRTGFSTASLENNLRLRSVPVIVRVQDDSIVFDVRCLSEADLVEIGDICAGLEKEEKS
ncbi:MAG: L-seryl-tRNA(Sec) selenium transferase [Negativicutes bacterium]|nr:L-seryl-tRNA(Sec) selenium transferase [Negativicutes bacterium]